LNDIHGGYYKCPPCRRRKAGEPVEKVKTIRGHPHLAPWCAGGRGGKEAEPSPHRPAYEFVRAGEQGDSVTREQKGNS